MGASLTDMTTPDKRTIAGMAVAAAVLLLLTPFIAALSCGCATPGPNADGNTIPHFAWVEPGIARGGQPVTDADWAWLVSHGLTNDLKLNTGEEGRDGGALKAGMTMHYHPIDTMQQLTDGPNDKDFRQAVSEVTPGTFVHCEHGRERTGLIIGAWELGRGTNKADALQHQLDHGSRILYMHGLHEYWEHYQP